MVVEPAIAATLRICRGTLRRQCFSLPIFFAMLQGLVVMMLRDALGGGMLNGYCRDLGGLQRSIARLLPERAGMSPGRLKRAVVSRVLAYNPLFIRKVGST